MEHIQHRISSYCNVVQRDVNVEFSILLTGGNLEFCTTCTGIEEKCRECPVVQYNESYPSSIQKRLPPV